MVSQPSPNKRFPGSFFEKRAKHSNKPLNPLQLDALENRTTPTLGWNSPWMFIPEPTAELSLIAAVNPDERLDLVGEICEADRNGPFEELALEEDAWDEEDEVDLSAEEGQEWSLEDEPSLVPEAASTPEPDWSAPSIMVDMRRESRVEPAEVARETIRSLEMELGRLGTVTVGARSFGTSDPVYSGGSTQTSQFLIRPGLVTPIHSLVTPIQKPAPEKSPARSSGQLAAWGVVMASSAAHLATNLPAKRRLTVESQPES